MAVQLAVPEGGAFVVVKPRSVALSPIGGEVSASWLCSWLCSQRKLLETCYSRSRRRTSTYFQQHGQVHGQLRSEEVSKKFTARLLDAGRPVLAHWHRSFGSNQKMHR